MRLKMKEREELEMHGAIVVANFTSNGPENWAQHTQAF